MAVYWCDPFLEATTQGNGTTDTSTEDGSYAAPFAFNKIVFTSNTSQSSVNGVSLSNGDEIRLKGIAFSTLFESHGNVYPTGSGLNERFAHLEAVTGNSSADFEQTTSRSSLYAFQNSDISSYFNGWSHPFFFSQTRYGNSTRLEADISSFSYSVLRGQLGYTSASSTGMEVFRLKDTYANVYTSKPTSGGAYNYIGNFTTSVKISAGWTSETAQNGYSVIEYTTFTLSMYLGGGDSNTKTYFDLGRMVMIPRAETTGYYFTGLDIRPLYCTDGGTGKVTMPILVTGSFYGPNIYSISSSNSSSIDVEYPFLSGNGEYIFSHVGTDIYNYKSGQKLIFKNVVHGYGGPYIQITSGDFEWGNMYVRAEENAFGNHLLFYFTNNATATHTHTFLTNSIYFMSDDSSDSDVNTFLVPNAGKAIYQSGLKQPGQAPLTNLTGNNTAYGPNFGEVISDGADLFLTEITINNSQEWFDPTFKRNGSDPITYTSVGKAACGGSNFRTLANNIKMQTETALGATDAPNFSLVTAEHNDYDGRPIGLLGDPYTAGTNYASLMYNDTVSSTDVLVGQWCGVTGASTQAWIPLDLAVPSYTAASDNLRAKVVVAYADGNDNSAAGSILLRAWHRDTTQSNNFRVYSSSATTVTAGGNPASPTTVTLNLSNVATSGQEDITSVCLGIRLDFASNTNIQKYYIVSADIETY